MGLTATVNAVEAERQELTWLLSSGVLGRSNNLARMLTFICEMYFEGREDQIKEYSIAVEALGRRADFDPHVDTIVRVTAHSLRKRLQEVYQNEGAGRSIRVVIPPGNYAPSFLVNEDARVLPAPEPPVVLAAEAPRMPELMAPAAVENDSPGSRRLWLAAAVCVLVFAVSVGGVMVAKKVLGRRAAQAAAISVLSASGSPAAIRVLPGVDRAAYVDHSGNKWVPGGSCAGGESVSLTPQNIGGTLDPALYLGGVRGISHCVFPVPAGTYELHLHFAETTSLEPATHAAVLSINAGPNLSYDVVDEAGGTGIATSFLMRGVRPENDGAIHVDFYSETSLLNAIEIMPAATDAPLPIRIVASASAFTDEGGQVWLSDRYFVGGRRGQTAGLFRVADLGLFASDRIGHFRYSIPVVPGEKYRVRLYFREPWFGKQNGAGGGVGHRIFDVTCNGGVLLKNFDVLGEGDAKPVVKTFDNVEATAHGKIELTFIPVVNYPVVNAIEVIPEP